MPDKQNEELNEGEMEKASGGGGTYSISSEKTSARASTGDNFGEEVESSEAGGSDRSDRKGLGGSVRL
jgi:hypothetical protein